MHSIPGSLWRSIPAVLIFLTLVIPIAPARTIYVSPSGVPDGTGETWATAFKTITAGLAVAQTADTVWVKSGTYAEELVLEPKVSLFGGFAGNETTLEERDWRIHRTVIDGASRPIAEYLICGAKDALLDGFIITGGIGGGNSSMILCQDTSLSIDHCTIAGNATHAVYCFNSSVNMRNSAIVNNSGNGIRSNSKSTLALNDCIVENNGNSAMYCRDSSLTIDECTIKGNGGGVNCYACTVTLKNCSIENNRSGGVYFDESSSGSVTGCTIAGNSGRGRGGGMGFYNSTLTVTDCFIGGNTANGNGGGSIVRLSLLLSLPGASFETIQGGLEEASIVIL